MTFPAATNNALRLRPTTSSFPRCGRVFDFQTFARTLANPSRVTAADSRSATSRANEPGPNSRGLLRLLRLQSALSAYGWQRVLLASSDRPERRSRSIPSDLDGGSIQAVKADWIRPLRSGARAAGIGKERK